MSLLQVDCGTSYAVACRGSGIPGANPVILCPTAPKTIAPSLHNTASPCCPPNLIPGLLALLQLQNPPFSGCDGGRPPPCLQSKDDPAEVVVGSLPGVQEPDSPWRQPSALPAAVAAVCHPLAIPGQPAMVTCLRWLVLCWLLLSLLPACGRNLRWGKAALAWRESGHLTSAAVLPTASPPVLIAPTAPRAGKVPTHGEAPTPARFHLCRL